MDWLQLATASGLFGAIGFALGAYFRHRPAMKHAEIEADGPLWERIGALEAAAKIEREECQRRVAVLEAHVADLEHDHANEVANMDAFLLLAEVNPEKIREMVPILQQRQREHKERMANKRATREAAVIAAATEG